MKAIKKLLAILLALCVLCGLPFAVSATTGEEYVTYTATQIGMTDTTVTVQLKFSEPVWLRSGHVQLCNDLDPAQCSATNTNTSTKWQLSGPSGSPALTAEFADNYYDTYTLTYPLCKNEAHTNHYQDWANGLPDDAIIRIVELISYEGALNDQISTQVVKSQSGKVLKAEYANAGMEVAPVTIEHMPKAVSAVVENANDAGGVNVLVTFNKPVNMGSSATGYIHLCDKYNPNPNKEVTVNGVTYISWQKTLSSYTYVNGTTSSDGKTYATQVMLTFPSPGTPLPSTAGIRFVEYFQNEELNNGEVWGNVIADENGIGLMPTVQDGTVDISWITVSLAEDAQKIVAASPVSATQVRVSFAMMVKAIDITNAKVGNQAVTAAARVGGDANGSSVWLLTLGGALTESDKWLTLPSGSVTMAYDGAVVDKDLTASVDPWSDYSDTEAAIELKDKAYNFMNTDTGRVLAIRDATTVVDEFTVVRRSEGSNLIALKYGERYVDLRSSEIGLVDVPVYYLLRACANQRYQLLINPDYAVADSDAGTDHIAMLTTIAAAGKDISTGWYITPSGETRPLKVMPLGDSITYGVDDSVDASVYRVGYREKLSQDLTEYFGRVVFVGSAKTRNNSGGVAATTLDETRLLRHEGWPGWVIKHIWPDASVSMVRDGLVTLIDASTQKYAPDIVCLMIGTNDYGQISSYSSWSGTSKEDNIAAWLEEYEAFVKQIEETMNDNGLLICSSITPNRTDATDEAYKALGEKIKSLVQTLSDNGTMTCFADNHAAVQAAVDQLGKDAVFADSVHLKAAGSEAMADEYYRVITAAYGQNSQKKTYTVSGLSGDGYTVTTNDPATVQPGQSFSFTVEADNGYEGTPTVKVNGVDIAAVNGVYTIRNILADQAITVTGLRLPIQAGWQLNEVGWWYLNADGSYPANTWAYIDNVWYYFDAAGYMTTGWQYIGGVWYYMNAGGAMVTGWHLIDGTWYYFDGSGAMVTGWLLLGNTWYYMNAGGAMVTGWQLIDGTWYYFDGSGAMVTGWLLLGNTWYYMNDSGAMHTGWLLLGSTWYYMDGSGAMQTGWILLNGFWYLLDSSGAWVA